MQDFSGGGAEKMMVHLANEFAKNESLDFTLFVVRKEGPYLDYLNPDVFIVEAKSSRVLETIFQFSKFLKVNKPDAILSTLKHVNIASIMASKLAGNKSRVVIREACHLTYDNSVSLRQRIAFKLLPYAYPKANAIIAVSEGVKKSVQDTIVGMADVFVINNPVITHEIVEKYAEPLGDEAFPLDSKVIISSGRLEYQKDYETLIRAFAMVKSEIPNSKLCILGIGFMLSYYNDLCNKLEIAADVIFLGFKLNPYKYLANSNVFVLSSRYEGSPNVLVEAMAAGIPVVATDCPSGPKEILENGKFGKLIPIGDVNEMKRAIISQLVSPMDISASINKTKEYLASNVSNDYLKVLLSNR